MNSPGQNTGVGSHPLLQGIFPIQGSNPGLPHCRQILYQLSHQGSPRIMEWVAYPFSRGSSWSRNWTGVSCTAGRFFTCWVTREAHWDFPIQRCWGQSRRSSKGIDPMKKNQEALLVSAQMAMVTHRTQRIQRNKDWLLPAPLCPSGCCSLEWRRWAASVLVSIERLGSLGFADLFYWISV